MALGLPPKYLATFPPEFLAGMAARASMLGDFGESAPSRWREEFRDPARVDVILSIYGYAFDEIGPVAKQVTDGGARGAFELASATPLDGEALEPPSHDDAMAPVTVKRPDDENAKFARHVHFGYRDGIAQPRFEGIHDPEQYANRQLFAPIGAVLLGHPTPLAHVRWRVPEPEALGMNGSFNAFRVLRQDVAAFEQFLADAAAKVGCGPELVAAKLCGRWRNGVPLSLAPTEAKANEMAASATTLNDINDFDYLDLDADGARCPVGSHIRRSNPRRAHMVQRAANRTRLIGRRGMPYGKRFDPATPDTVERGLLGNFMCASLSAQFEATHHDWLNLGLQDPRITGTNDPLVGANDPETSEFAFADDGGEDRIFRGLPRLSKHEEAPIASCQACRR